MSRHYHRHSLHRTPSASSVGKVLVHRGRVDKGRQRRNDELRTGAPVERGIR